MAETYAGIESFVFLKAANIPEFFSDKNNNCLFP